jgi:GNAT superfamily N-acetyltransferase
MGAGSAAQAVVIEPFLGRAWERRVLDAIDRIFFEASHTQSFASAEAREAFRERWLQRYLTHDPEHAFLAIVAPGTADEDVVGYLVGSLDDPAQASRFGDLGYFRDMQELTAQFPAQLHVNLAARWQGQGIGRALVEAFCAHAARQGVAGVHVFTGRGLRNTAFYEAAAFKEVGSVNWNSREIVMLGRRLEPPT